MEQGHDLATSSSGCAERAARVPGHAQSCLLRAEKAIIWLIHPGKTPSGNKERREEVSRAAEGPALKSQQGQQLLAAEPSEVPAGWQEQQGGSAGAQPPPRDPLSLLPPQGPGRSPAASLDRPKVTRARVRAGGSPSTAACRGAQGSTCPPGSPGPRCGNQVSTGSPGCPGGPQAVPGVPAPPGIPAASSLGLLGAVCTGDLGPGFNFEISCYFNLQ